MGVVVGFDEVGLVLGDRVGLTVGLVDGDDVDGDAVGDSVGAANVGA